MGDISDKVTIMGGGGNQPEFKIPDYRIYKIDGIKDLEWVRDELAKKGLKDPWLRNEVWRYKGYTGRVNMAFNFFKRGFVGAALLMGVTIAIDKGFGISE